jgi:hypothetical protein
LPPLTLLVNSVPLNHQPNITSPISRDPPGPCRSLIFHPLVVLGFSLLGAAVCAGYVTKGFSSQNIYQQTYYVVPIVVPFVAFIFDRAERVGEVHRLQFVTDALIIGLAMGRVVGSVPYVSGHTLFLTYALLTARSRVLLITCGLVMLHAVYLKYIVWHDWVTSTVGIVLGTLAAFGAWRLRSYELRRN